jgi:hypothetical protein
MYFYIVILSAGVRMRILFCYSFCIYSSPFCVCCLLTFFTNPTQGLTLFFFNAVENIELCVFCVSMCENNEWRFLSCNDKYSNPST